MEKNFAFDSIRDASGKGDRVYKSEDFANYFNKFITDGYFPNVGDNIQVIADGTGMKVRVRPGAAWMKGRMYHNTDDKELKIDVADGVLSRIDRVVIRCDYLARVITAEVKKGKFASSPVAPELQRDTDIYELGIADIFVKNGAITVSQANVTDLRLNKDLCGVVNSLLQADTTLIFKQFQSWFDQTKVQGELDLATWTTQYKQEFESWFSELKYTLDGDVAGNLFNKIDVLKQDIGDKSTLLTTNKTSIVNAMNELFTSADNGKKALATVIGSPATSDNTFVQLKTHIQNAKNKGAANLTAKGTSASGTESLDSLMSKIANVNTGKKWATGTGNLPGTTASITISGLTFIPSLLAIVYSSEPNANTPNIDVAFTWTDFSGLNTGWKQSLADMAIKVLPATKPNSPQFTIKKAFSDSYTMYYRWYAVE
ncbi:hypothetical protein V7183_03535 [Bacillus sp. JJ1127]|uniref:hypothetical protein n=1 Tax=Bacillus sp. JJ1127 TaxID=3122952 RepID=UPI0030008A9B